MNFGLLGSVSVQHEGRDFTIGSAQQRCVLAVLLLEAGRVVPTERLVDTLWDHDTAPKTARNILQGCVSALRRILSDDPDVRLVLKPPGYLLEVDPERIDLARFRHLVDQARTGGDDERVRLLRQALVLWRAEPLADVTASGLDAVKQALADERLSALEDCLDLELRSDKHHDLVAELTVLVAEHPLRERFRGQLMHALYRCGRAGDAVGAFHDLRRLLAEELGTDPGPELQDLYQQILNANPVLDHAAPAPSAVPRQLPSAPGAFSGRQRELSTLTIAPDADTVVISALGGFGGIGKTWLALHWAHRNIDWFPDGQLFVNLRGFDPRGKPMPPEVAVRGFLNALGVPAAAIPVDPHAQNALYRTLVADKRMLIVLDNARDSAQVVPLLPGSPTCTVLVTSRDRMQGLATTHNARTLALDVLPEPEARALLALRLGETRLEHEPDAVDELLRHCAGLPLALGIVAGRAAAHPDFPLNALAAELRDARLDALDTGDPATNLAAVLSWSYHALTPQQAAVFGWLGLAPGPDISLDAATNLANLPTRETRAVLRTLRRASLVDEHRPNRYRMHDLIRLFAAQRAEDGNPALRRLVDFYLHTAHAADGLLDPIRQLTWFDPPNSVAHPHMLVDAAAAMTWFDSEHACLLAAQQITETHGWYRSTWQLASCLHIYHRRRGYGDNELTVWQAALAAAERVADTAIQSLACRQLGDGYTLIGQHDDAVDHLQRALTLAEHNGDLASQADAHQALSWAWDQNNDNRRALEHATHALRFYQTLDFPVREAQALNNVGWCAAQLGDYEQARTHCEAALALSRRDHHPESEAATLDSLGYIVHRTGDHDLAIDYYRQALALFRTLGNSYEEANTLDNIGHPYAASGRHDRARSVWSEAAELYRLQERHEDADRVRRLSEKPKHGSYPFVSGEM